MKELNRRDLCLSLSALGLLSAASSSAQNPTSRTSPGEQLLSASRSYPYSELPVSHSANGESRKVVSGLLPTGEAVELHETTLLPGHMPHQPHQHLHSEFMMIREGTLEFLNDGKPEQVGPGGVIFASSGILHGVKNVGDTPARYFVIAIGRQQGV